MDAWKTFTEILLPEKEEFYFKLNVKYIVDAEYAHLKRVCKDFEIKKNEENKMIRMLKAIHYC